MTLRPFNQVDPLDATKGFTAHPEPLDNKFRQEADRRCVYGCGRPAEPGEDACTPCLILEEEEEKALRYEDDRFAE